jgi:uncharacterized membrane protein YebE (DUF533 family)
MFDAKELLNTLVAGNSQRQPLNTADLGTILSQVLQQPSGPQPAAAAVSGQGGGGGLGDILGQILGGSGGQGGPLGQVLSGSNVQGGLAGAADIARSIFTKAAGGVQDAARQSGAAPALDDMIRQMTGGQGAGDLLTKAQQIIRDNPAAAGALAGALGSLVLGTGTGRSIAANAARLGGLVLIGGLGYKAYEDYKAGQTPTAASTAPAPAPVGSGFEPQAQSNDAALLYISAMIAAASADGTIDANERAKITVALQQAGHTADAAEFLSRQLSKPATVPELAAGATSPEIAVQVYTAARIAIEPHSPAEKAFLTELASALKLDPGLAQRIDAVATANKV